MPQHVPGSASQPFWWRADSELPERARRGSLGPSDSEATLLRLGGPAVRMSGKHEAAILFTPHDGSARNVPRQGAKVHLIASAIRLRLPDVRSAYAVTGRQQRKQTAFNKLRNELPIAQADALSQAPFVLSNLGSTSAAAGPGHLPAPAPRVTTPRSSSRLSDGPHDSGRGRPARVDLLKTAASPRRYSAAHTHTTRTHTGIY